jgi:hypothetical protein
VAVPHFIRGTATSDIRAVEFTPRSNANSRFLPELLHQIAEGAEIGKKTADRAYGARICPSAISEREATAITLIRKSGRPRMEDCLAATDRNETLRAARHDGWTVLKRWPGHHV